MRSKNPAKWLFDFYLFGNFHIALCAVALTLTTKYLFNLQLRHELLVFVFCGTFFGSSEHNAAATSSPIPKAVNGTVIPCVSIFNRPTMSGPKKPPTLPRAFTRPMTAPAATRGMVSMGMAKNSASDANGPGIARQSSA